MTIPSNKWFPTNLQDRAAWYQNFNTQLGGGVGTSLGLVVGDMTIIGNDNDVLTFCASSAVYFESFMDAVREYRKTVTEGKIGDPAPAFPTFISPGTPAACPTGIFERLNDFVDRIRAAPAYTPEIGGLLQIIPQTGDDLLESEMKPSLKASSMPGNVVEVSFTRGKSDGVEIETMIDGTGGWANVGRFFKSPASLDIPDGTGLPRAVQIRARFVIGNEAVGLNSDTVNVVTTP